MIFIQMRLPRLQKAQLQRCLLVLGPLCEQTRKCTELFDEAADREAAAEDAGHSVQFSAVDIVHQLPCATQGSGGGETTTTGRRGRGRKKSKMAMEGETKREEEDQAAIKKDEKLLLEKMVSRKLSLAETTIIASQALKIDRSCCFIFPFIFRTKKMTKKMTARKDQKKVRTTAKVQIK